MIKIINKSVKGGQKTKNDDRVFCKTYNDPSSVNKLNLVAIAAVADGVGGVKGGDKASAIAVKEFESRVERHRSFDSLKDIDEFFKNTYKEINQIVLKEQENQNFPDMCTTLVSAGLFRTAETEQCYLFVVNCGDSPLLCIDTDRDEIELLSTIHHTGSHLTQYLGKQNLEIHNSYCQCPKNGFILLSSDGLTGNMSNSPLVSREEIKKYLVETKSIDEASEILTKLAQYKGSSDDISVAIMEIGRPKRVKPKHLTPIASQRYRVVAERLVYAGCILISIIGLIYFWSLYNNLKDDYKKLKGGKDLEIAQKNNDWNVSIGSKNKEIKEADQTIRDLTQQIDKLTDGEESFKKTIESLKNEIKALNIKLAAYREEKNKGNLDTGNRTSGALNPEGLPKGKQPRQSVLHEKSLKIMVLEKTEVEEERTSINAKIYLDDILFGNTNAEGILKIERLEKNNYKLKIEKDGFLPMRREISLLPENVKAEYIILEKIPGTEGAGNAPVGENDKVELTIKVEDNEGVPLKYVVVFVDDEKNAKKTDNDGILKYAVTLGTHTFRAEKEGHDGDKKIIPISVDTKNVSLTLKSTNIVIGNVAVVEVKENGAFLPIAGAKVTLDEEYIGETREDGMIPINGKFGQHEIKVEKEGFNPVKKPIAISNDSKLGQIRIELISKKNARKKD